MNFNEPTTNRRKLKGPKWTNVVVPTTWRELGVWSQWIGSIIFALVNQPIVLMVLNLPKQTVKWDFRILQGSTLKRGRKTQKDFKSTVKLSPLWQTNWIIMASRGIALGFSTLFW